MVTNKFADIVIADSQFLIVETLRKLINESENYSLAGIVETVDELDFVLSKKGKVLLIADNANLYFEETDDLCTFKKKYPELQILILTNAINKADFTALSKIGIRNIIYKNVDREELFDAIEATLKGKKYYSEEIMDLFMELNESKYVVEESKNLTSSEIEIVKLIANGLTTKEIAFKRNISYHTVNTHRKNIFRKLEVTNSSELIILAIKAGWIDNIEYYI